MVTSLSYVQRSLEGKPSLVREDVELPEREPQQALVKITYVAQNPTDVQTLDSDAFGDGTVLGCDFVGVVEDVGQDVIKLKKGDTVAGLIWGGEKKGLGAYGTHTYVDENISFKFDPKRIKPEDAATVPLAATTAWLALLSKDCLGMPRDGSRPSVLIWGGSSSVGQYAIQLATRSGFEVITTASPKNHDLCESLGAKSVFDYRDDGVVDTIKAVCPTLQYVFDTIGNETSSETGSQAVRPEGGVLCTVRPGKANTEKVEKRVRVTDVLVWTAFLNDHAYKEFKYPASRDDHRLAIELLSQVPHWLESGQLKPNAVKLMTLDAIHEGFERYRQGRISAEKIVYRV